MKNIANLRPNLFSQKLFDVFNYKTMFQVLINLSQRIGRISNKISARFVCYCQVNYAESLKFVGAK